MSALTRIVTALAYDDVEATSNPTQIRVNRTKRAMNVPVENAGTLPLTLAPGATATVLDGMRTLAHDNTTKLQLLLSDLDPTRYRITWTDGTNPVFRTDRGLVSNGASVQWQVNANQTVTITIVAGESSAFSDAGVLVGDVLFVPGASTGDETSAFNPLNEGYWTVLAVNANQATVSRFTGEVFSGYTETVTSPGNSAIQAFSADGVQVGDTLDISAGFSSTARHAFEIVAVTGSWIEIQSTLPLADEVAQPGQAGFTIYTSAKRWILVEATQEIAVRLNGATDDSNRVSPWLAGSLDLAGTFEKVGPVWRLVVVNLSSTPATIVVSSAE